VLAITQDVRPGVAAFLAAIVLPLAACGGGGGSNGSDDWAGPPRPDDRGRLDVAGFNDYLDSHPEHATAPVVAATRFLRLDRAAAATTSVVARTSAEGGGPTTVTVTLDGVFDDSVRAERFVLELAQGDDGEWRMTSAESSRRCQPGRGHQAFTPAPCV
jgi:hypothetical protein